MRSDPHLQSTVNSNSSEPQNNPLSGQTAPTASSQPAPTVPRRTSPHSSRSKVLLNNSTPSFPSNSAFQGRMLSPLTPTAFSSPSQHLTSMPPFAQAPSSSSSYGMHPWPNPQFVMPVYVSGPMATTFQHPNTQMSNASATTKTSPTPSQGSQQSQPPASSQSPSSRTSSNSMLSVPHTVLMPSVSGHSPGYRPLVSPSLGYLPALSPAVFHSHPTHVTAAAPHMRAMIPVQYMQANRASHPFGGVSKSNAVASSVPITIKSSSSHPVSKTVTMATTASNLPSAGGSTASEKPHVLPSTTTTNSHVLHPTQPANGSGSLGISRKNSSGSSSSSSTSTSGHARVKQQPQRSNKHWASKSRSQNGENYRCDECGRTFGWKSTYLIHLRVHTGERPYECRFCGKTFSQKGNLSAHYRTHTGERPFNCRLCKKSFTQMHSLQSHMKLHCSVAMSSDSDSGKRKSASSPTSPSSTPSTSPKKLKENSD